MPGRILSPQTTHIYISIFNINLYIDAIPQLWEYQLEELALYFLLYTEGANLRHLPEGLWFLFWVFRNSAARMAEVGWLRHSSG